MKKITEPTKSFSKAKYLTFEAVALLALALVTPVSYRAMPPPLSRGCQNPEVYPQLLILLLVVAVISSIAATYHAVAYKASVYTALSLVISGVALLLTPYVLFRTFFCIG